MPQTLATGTLLGAAGDGRLSAASRRDLAEAAAAVLASGEHAGKVYELGGDQAFTLAELAAAIGEQGDREVVYRDLPEDEYARTLESFGLPPALTQMLASSDESIKRGEMQTESSDLRELIGHPTTSLKEAVAAQLGKLR